MQNVIPARFQRQRTAGVAHRCFGQRGYSVSIMGRHILGNQVGLLEQKHDQGEFSMICSQSLAVQRTRPGWNHQAISRIGATLIIALGLLSSSPAAAQKLDGDAIRDLVLKGTWAAQNDWGYWGWSEDSSLCLRLFGPDGDCADTGTWTINGDVMCYELTWWGESYDVRKNCYTVHPLEDGRYETRYHGGALDSTFTIFTIIE